MKNHFYPGQPLPQLATPHARKKGHAPWRPAPEGIYGRILRDALEVLHRYRNHLPLGPRTITYQLLPLWVPNYYRTKEQLRSAVSDVLGRARRAEIIPWEWIDDRRTAMAAPWTVADLPGVIANMQGARQKGQRYRIEVWVEAVGNLSRIGNICNEYGITVLSGSGSVPIEANRQAALRVVEEMRSQDRATLFLVVADFDPHGVKNIAMALEADVRAFVGDYGLDPDEALVVRQVALTEEQALTLPPERREPLTSAPKDWPHPFKAEVEAIDPDELDRLVEDALAVVRDEDALAAVLAAEPDERRDAVRRLVSYGAAPT